MRDVNERSTYRKFYTILGCAYAARTEIRSFDDLVGAVREARSLSFTYFRAHRRKGSEIVACGDGVVRQRVKACGDLGLVDQETGQLTKLGLEALKKEGFDRVLGRQVRKALEAKGFNFDVLRWRRRLGPDGYWLPTAQRLYETSQPGLTLVEFRRLLNLLVQSGDLQAVQSRVYFGRVGE